MDCIRNVSHFLIAGLLLSPEVVFSADDLEKQVETARAEVVKAMEGFGVTDADIEISLPMNPVLQAVAAMNTAPPEQRTIHVRSTAANGKLWEDGPTWCNSYAELRSPDGFKSDAVLSDFKTEFPSTNTLALSANVNVDANVGVHWHFMGRRFDVKVAGVKVGNACPPGGGFGGHIGASGKTGFRLTGHVTLIQDGGDFSYQVALVDPPKVNMTISFGFERIGELGVPQSFDLPLGVVASGHLPLMIGRQGEVTLPGGQKKTYSVSLTPKRLNIDQTAAVGAWTGKVEIAAPNEAAMGQAFLRTQRQLDH